MSINMKLNEVAQYVCDKYADLEFNEVTFAHECVNDICQSVFGKIDRNKKNNIVKALVRENSELRILIRALKEGNESITSLNNTKIILKIAKYIEHKKFNRNDFEKYNLNVIDDICRQLKFAINNKNRIFIHRQCNKVFNEIFSYTVLKDDSIVNVTNNDDLKVETDSNISIENVNLTLLESFSDIKNQQVSLNNVNDVFNTPMKHENVTSLLTDNLLKRSSLKVANNTEIVSDIIPMHSRKSWVEELDMSKLDSIDFDIVVNSTPIVNKEDIITRVKSSNEKYKLVASPLRNALMKRTPVKSGIILPPGAENRFSDSAYHRMNNEKTYSSCTFRGQFLITKEEWSLIEYVNDKEIHSLTGKNLASAILEGLNSCGLDCSKLYGQGYDGAANMSGKHKGVQTIIRNIYPKAIYVHCAAHSLNLAVSSSCDIQSVRNCLGLVEKMHCFFNSPIRNGVLLEAISNSELHPSTKSLKRLCATRWVARYTAINDIVELFPCIVEALEEIKLNSYDKSSENDADILIKAMDSEFLITLQVVKVIFSYCLPLCKSLQTIDVDLKEATQLAECNISMLENLRNNIETEFNLLFKEAEKMATILDLMSIKRLTNKQKNRANTCLVGNIQPESYYRITVAIPYIDAFIINLRERFLDHKNIFEGFQCLFSSEIEIEPFKKLVDFYLETDFQTVLAELKIWKEKLKITKKKILNQD